MSAMSNLSKVLSAIWYSITYWPLRLWRWLLKIKELVMNCCGLSAGVVAGQMPVYEDKLILKINYTGNQRAGQTVGIVQLQLSATAAFTVFWGDGTSANVSVGTALVSKQYATKGEYTIETSLGARFKWARVISEHLEEIVSFGHGPIEMVSPSSATGTVGKLQRVPRVLPPTVRQIGFLLNHIPDGAQYWDTSKVTNLQGALQNVQGGFDRVANWDVSNVTNFINLVSNYVGSPEAAGIPSIAGWNTQSATNMTNFSWNNTIFNLDLSGWCVPLITTKPTNFDTGATAWTLPKPVWGTCPPSL